MMLVCRHLVSVDRLLRAANATDALKRLPPRLVGTAGGSLHSVNNIKKMSRQNKISNVGKQNKPHEHTPEWISASSPSSSRKGLAYYSSLGTSAELVSKDGKHSISIEVSAPLIRFVKGKFGFTQRQIEEENGVKLIMPSSKENSSITIEGISVDSVEQASKKIIVIIEEVVKGQSLDYSHFISLPLAVHGDLVEKLINFQNCILGGPEPHLSDLGVDRSIFINPKTFHLTVLMLKLYDKDRIATATTVLQEISAKVKDALDNQPIFIRLKGLACMRGSPAKACVLYAPVEEIDGEGRLLRACKVIIDAFFEAGLISREDARKELKLHATLMNVRHRKRKDRTKKFDFFDARGIFEKYGSEEWGEYLIGAAHLSQRFKFDERGYYHCCKSIPLPGNMQSFCLSTSHHP